MKIPGLKASSQEKVNKALAAARKHGANIVRGVKGSAFSLATGAIAWDLGKMATDKSETIRNNAYALPIAYAVLGHIIKKKQYDVGAGLLGVAGFIGRQAYESEANKKKAGAVGPAVAAAGGAANAPAGTAKGVGGGEAGAVVGRWQRVLDTRGVSGGEAGAVVNGPRLQAPAPRMTAPNEAAAVVRSQYMGLSDI